MSVRLISDGSAPPPPVTEAALLESLREAHAMMGDFIVQLHAAFSPQVVQVTRARTRTQTVKASGMPAV